MNELTEAIEKVALFKLHPLGFFFLLSPLDDGRTQRIHVWLPVGLTSAENDRHQHSFDIESRVVLGKMRSELFRFEESVDGDEVEFEVSYGGGGSKLTPSGRRGFLLPVAAFDTATGSTYRLEAGTIHRVNVVQSPCVTVVKTLDRGIQIYTYGRQNEEPAVRRFCTTEEAETLKKCLIDASAFRS